MNKQHQIHLFLVLLKTYKLITNNVYERNQTGFTLSINYTKSFILVSLCHKNIIYKKYLYQFNLHGPLSNIFSWIKIEKNTFICIKRKISHWKRRLVSLAVLWYLQSCSSASPLTSMENDNPFHVVLIVQCGCPSYPIGNLSYAIRWAVTDRRMMFLLKASL